MAELWVLALSHLARARGDVKGSERASISAPGAQVAALKWRKKLVVDMQAQEGWGALPFIADGASGLSKRLLLLAPNFLCNHHRCHPGEVPLNGSWKLGQQAPATGHHLPPLQWGSRPQRCPLLFPRNAPKMHISPKSYCLTPCPGKPPQELWGAGTPQHSSHQISRGCHTLCIQYVKVLDETMCLNSKYKYTNYGRYSKIWIYPV